jgi:hypothetical protein
LLFNPSHPKEAGWEATDLNHSFPDLRPSLTHHSQHLKTENWKRETGNGETAYSSMSVAQANAHPKSKSVRYFVGKPVPLARQYRMIFESQNVMEDFLV